MARSRPEWIGKNDDEPVPDRVRLRVFDKAKGLCAECKNKIIGGRWVCDHRIAIINGGENREKNLGAICDLCDRKVKTPRDVAEKALIARVKAKHLGIKRRKGRPMPGSKASGVKMKIGGGWEKRK